MMEGLKALFRIRETYIGIVATIAFQLIFFSVWMTAYDGVNDRTKNLKVGLISEDVSIDQKLTTKIQESLPFSLKTFSSIKEAENQLDQRNIHMLIHIPADFTTQLQNGEETSIVYSINQANASLVKSAMESTAKQVTAEVNLNVYALQQSETVKAFSQQFTQLPLDQDLASIILETVTSTISNMESHLVSSTIIKTNNVDGFAANFVPLMVIISSFVGAMVMIMQHQHAVEILQATISKWSLFFGRQLINMIVAFTLSFLTIALMYLFSITSDKNFLTIYLFQSFMFWAFLSLAQVFVIVFGNLGMVFNICALSLQLVTSGVLVPKEMLSVFYSKLANLLPATYGADGYFTIVFGGSTKGIHENIGSLGIIIAVTMAISFIVVALKRTKIPTPT